MKRFLKAICFFCVVALPLVAFAAVYDMSRTGIIAGMQRETKQYLSIPGVSATGSQIAALDANIRAIKYSAGVSLTAVTLNLSTASGAYFLTRSSVDLRPYALIAGAQISVAATGTPGTTAVFGGLSLPTGETVGEELNPDVGFASAAGWTTQNGWSINESTGKAVAVIGSGVWLFRAATRTVGGLYKSTLDIDAIAGASVRIGYEGSNETGPEYTTTGSKLEYHTQRVSTVPVVALYRFAPWSLTGTFDNLSSKQVLTADLSGVQASALTNGGINPDSASYVVTITRP